MKDEHKNGTEKYRNKLKQDHICNEKTEIDELLETIWEMAEEDISTEARYRDSGQGRVILENLKRLINMNLVTNNHGLIEFTPEGEIRARNIVRRHRLSERMLTDLFDIPRGRIEGTSCELEHVLSEEVTDSICAFLGHPPVCPHGRAIPPGECCKKPGKTIQPLVIPLTELKPEETGQIVFIQSRDKNSLRRMSSLGIIPNTEITLTQKIPMIIVRCAETEIALDRDIAEGIYLKRKP